MIQILPWCLTISTDYVYVAIIHIEIGWLFVEIVVQDWLLLEMLLVSVPHEVPE